MPPMDYGSPTHPDLDVYYNATFDEVTFEWAPPSPDALGYWYVLSKSAGVAVSPANGSWLDEPSLTLPASAFTSAGVWYVHIVTVAADGTAGVLASSIPFRITAAPPSLSSPSHPDESAWYEGVPPLAAAFDIAPPAGVPADSYAGFWYRTDQSSKAVPGKADAGYTFTAGAELIITEDFDGEPLDDGTWYLHVAGEDQVGNLSATVATYRLQLGAEPGKVNLFGYVKDPLGTPLQGATLTFEPYGLSDETDGNGYFIVPDVYQGVYIAEIARPGYVTKTQAVTVTGTPQALNITLTPLP
jgi:hypothetical protein